LDSVGDDFRWIRLVVWAHVFGSGSVAREADGFRGGRSSVFVPAAGISGLPRGASPPGYIWIDRTHMDMGFGFHSPGVALVCVRVPAGYLGPGGRELSSRCELVRRGLFAAWSAQ